MFDQIDNIFILKNLYYVKHTCSKCDFNPLNKKLYSNMKCLV